MMITKGKWIVREYSDGEIKVGIRPESGFRSICDIVPMKEDKDNARLIAAAPDLLAALKMAKSLMNANTLLDAGNPASMAIVQAIAKAEGV